MIGNKGLRFGDVCGEVVVHDGVFEDGEPVLPVGVAIFLRLPQTLAALGEDLVLGPGNLLLKDDGLVGRVVDEGEVCPSVHLHVLALDAPAVGCAAVADGEVAGPTDEVAVVVRLHIADPVLQMVGREQVHGLGLGEPEAG